MLSRGNDPQFTTLTQFILFLTLFLPQAYSLFHSYDHSELNHFGTFHSLF